METTKAGESTPRQIPTSAAGIGMLIVEPDRHHQKMRAAAPQTRWRCCSPRAAAIVIHTRVELVIRSTRVIRCCPQSAPKRRPPPPPPPLTARRPFCAQALAETYSSIGYIRCPRATALSGEDALALVSTHQVCNHRPTPTARCNHRPTRTAPRHLTTHTPSPPSRNAPGRVGGTGPNAPCACTCYCMRALPLTRGSADSLLLQRRLTQSHCRRPYTWVSSSSRWPRRRRQRRPQRPQ